MLTVTTRIAASPIHGIGLFAAQDIPRGTVIWRLVPEFDLVFDKETFERLPEPARIQVNRYSYLASERGAYVLCGDDARFMNHSATPNTFEESEARTVAARDIAAGEEITCDYNRLGPGPLGHEFALEPDPA
jgi:SET domain-containing protein